jgi:hypothetical protein
MKELLIPIVEKEMDNQEALSESEYQKLLGNVDLWKQILSEKVAALDTSFANNKAESFLDCAKFKNGSQEMKDRRNQYEEWKARAVGYKRVLLKKLQEVKLIQKQRNIDDRKERPHSEILEEILSVLKSFRKKLPSTEIEEEE